MHEINLKNVVKLFCDSLAPKIANLLDTPISFKDQIVTDKLLRIVDFELKSFDCEMIDEETIKSIKILFQ